MATSVPIAPGVKAGPQGPQPDASAARVAATAAGQGKAVPANEAKAAAQLALVPAVQTAPVEQPRIPPDSPAMRLRVELEVGVPVGEFRVRNLLALEPGVVVESRWNHGEDLPLAAGRVQLAWTEFEVVETVLGARLTRLA